MKTLKDLEEGFGHLEEGRVRDAAIEWIKNRYMCKCSCGSDLEQSWDGETDCKIFSEMLDKDFETGWLSKNEHVNPNPDNGDIDVKNWIMNFFNITKEDLK